ncbi:MAG: hypothetical protein K8I60_20435 [Anaerolineae bacterium]|nr:hypothetical protein [Anaerolineae bacterium]
MKPEPSPHDWIAYAKAQGWGGAVTLALDALEPLGPLGAQLLWITQPVLGLAINRDVVADLAQMLETPGGIEALRRQLDDEV